MRAFLALVFLFSLSVGKFDDWLKKLRKNQLNRHYERVRYEVKGPVEEFHFKFNLEQAKPRTSTYYLFAKLVVTHPSPHYGIHHTKVDCQLLPDMPLLTQEVILPLNKWRDELTKMQQDILQKHRQQHPHSVNYDQEKYGMMYGLSNAKWQVDKLEAQMKYVLSDKGKVLFTFNPDKNSGSYKWIGATHYLFYGKKPTHKSYGAIIMDHVMNLYELWIDPSKYGEVEGVDQSLKHLEREWWNELCALSS